MADVITAGLRIGFAPFQGQFEGFGSEQAQFFTPALFMRVHFVAISDIFPCLTARRS